MSILDEFSYPFWSREAQYLHVVLAELYPEPEAAVLMAQRAEMAVVMILRNQAPLLLWKAILDEAARQGRTRDLVRAVHDTLNERSPYRPFLTDLLENRATATPGEPRDANGAPAFLSSDDTITEPEAMLFRDDLTLPVGQLPALITTLERLVTLAPAVCKLTVDISGTPQFGTGFRIGERTLLTNWHVLHSNQGGSPATAVSAEFGYDDDGAGGLRPASVVTCDPDTVVSRQANDWAVIQARDALHDEWRAIDLASAAVPTTASSAFIVQHPGGQRKRVGIVRNRVSSVNDRVVHYLTDTDVGSSGSPVFDGDGLLIALHHAGGRPISVLGQSPIRKNEGIRISAVSADLDEAGVTVT